MPKPIESLSGADATNFRAAISPHVDALLAPGTAADKIGSTDGPVGTVLAARKVDRREVTQYALYAPTITGTTIIEESTGYLYNHDSAIIWFDGFYFAFWNANTANSEGATGQVILMKKSATFAGLASAAAVRCFVDAAYTDDPVTAADGAQWQPGCVVIGGVLHVLWSQTGGVNVGTYHSTLSASSAKFTTTKLASISTISRNGIDYDRGFVCGDIAKLPMPDGSTRYLCPIIYQSSTTLTPILSMPNTSMTSAFLRQAKLAGCIYNDDDGSGWKLGGLQTDPARPWIPWEPFFSVQDDGSLRMFLRSLNNFDNATNFQLSCISLDGGLSFGPFLSTNVEVPTTRGLVLAGSDLSTPRMQINNDNRIAAAGEVFGPSGRRALALWLGRGGNDFVPGVPISDDDVHEGACYPSACEVNGKIVVSFSTQNLSPSNVNSRIYGVEVDAPPTGGIVMARGNARTMRSPTFVSAGTGPYAHFFQRSYSRLATAANLSATALSATQQTIAAMFESSEYGAIYDCRGPTQTGWFVRTAGTLRIGVYNSDYPDATTGVFPFIEFNFASLATPLNEIMFVAVAIDTSVSPVTVTGTVTRADGTSTSETISLLATTTASPSAAVAFAPRSLLPAAPAFLGNSVVSSVTCGMKGRIRFVKAFSGLLDANNLRSVRNAAAAATGVTTWAGTETAPSAAVIDLDATDASAGTNNGTWTAKFTPTGQTDGTVTTVTRSGRQALLITGMASASVVPPSAGFVPNHYSFEYEAIAGRTQESIICTLGSASNNVMLVKSVAGGIVLRQTINGTVQSDITMGSGIADAHLHDVAIYIADRRVTVSHTGVAPIIVPFHGRAILFLGKGWAPGASATDNGLYFFVDSIASKNAQINEPALGPLLRERLGAGNATDVYLENALGGGIGLGPLGTNRWFMTAAGLVSFGAGTSPAARLHVTYNVAPAVLVDGFTSPEARFLSSGTISNAFSGGQIGLYSAGVTAGNVMAGVSVASTNGSAGTGTFQIARRQSDRSTAGNLLLYTDGTGWNFYVGTSLTTATTSFSYAMTNSAFSSGTDNSRDLGSGSVRWKIVYAATGTINTSDEHHKHWIGPVGSGLKAAMARIKDEIGLYQWNDARAEKGDGARLHVGVRAQRCIQIMVEEGCETEPAAGWRDAVINPYAVGTELTLEEWETRKVFIVPARAAFRHAFLCCDVWDDVWEDIMADGPPPPRPDDLPEDQPWEPTPPQIVVGKRLSVAGGRLYSLRGEQLLFAMMEAL